MAPAFEQRVFRDLAPSGGVLSEILTDLPYDRARGRLKMPFLLSARIPANTISIPLVLYENRPNPG